MADHGHAGEQDQRKERLEDIIDIPKSHGLPVRLMFNGVIYGSLYRATRETGLTIPAITAAIKSGAKGCRWLGRGPRQAGKRF